MWNYFSSFGEYSEYYTRSLPLIYSNRKHFRRLPTDLTQLKPLCIILPCLMITSRFNDLCRNNEYFVKPINPTLFICQLRVKLWRKLRSSFHLSTHLGVGSGCIRRLMDTLYEIPPRRLEGSGLVWNLHSRLREETDFNLRNRLVGDGYKQKLLVPFMSTLISFYLERPPPPLIPLSYYSPTNYNR